MNEPGSLIPSPRPSSAGGKVDLREPGPTAAELVPIHGLGGVLDALLRRPRRLSHHLSGADAPRLIGLMLLLTVAGAGLYGEVVGTFSGGTQLWAAPAKITGGLLVCGIICLRSLYVFACLAGATARLGDVAGMVAGLFALTTLLLFSSAPAISW